ncbi:Flp pilus assembly protein CpaB [Cochlodiniinecator piscidefendens]|uniref:Flp pilus assembly protein CpaB n=1 Tax=Cochlodiniinecator piscidefendens TaxID=2715756 RepID=UPI0014080D00|nr:Flp pilus assembly protein CpaB [Cochlodiniinecator piscidefendens]
MRAVFGLVLLLGVALAGFAVYQAKGYVGAYQAQLELERQNNRQIVPTVEVFIANRQILYGERITREDIASIRWPENAIPEGAFLAFTDLFPEGQPEFREALRTIEESEAFLPQKVTEPGEIAGIMSQLASGSSAFTVNVDASTAVSGFLRPGHRVNVYWTGDWNGQEITRLIENAVSIVAIDQSANEERDQNEVPRTVTVQVSPQQVAALAQAQSTGRLSLSLVGNNDATVAEVIEVDQNRLLGIQERQVVEVARERVCTTRVRRGAEVIDTQIPCTN